SRACRPEGRRCGQAADSNPFLNPGSGAWAAPWRREFAIRACRRDRLEPSAFGGLEPSGWNSKTDRPQGALAETLDIALTGLRKRDDVLRKRRTNGIVMVEGGTERGQRHFKGNAH